jgi:hypothetical protein
LVKYQIDVTDDAVVEVDVSPGLPVLTSVQLTWTAPRAQRESVARKLGMNPRAQVMAWRRAALRRDGERVGQATIVLREVG